jgi:hypothetical protein
VVTRQKTVALVAGAGIGLFVTGETLGQFERLEGNYGLGLVNVILAVPIAAIVLTTAALVGDSLLESIARRTGHRPGDGLWRAGLALCAAGASVVAGATRPQLHLMSSGWVTVLGCLLLVGAAAAQRGT